MKDRKSPVFPPTAHVKAIMNPAAAMGPKDVLSSRASLQKCGASFPLSESSGCFTWVKHLGSV